MDRRCESCGQPLPGTHSDSVVDIQLAAVGAPPPQGEPTVESPALPVGESGGEKGGANSVSADTDSVSRRSWTGRVVLAGLLVLGAMWFLNGDADTGPTAGSTGDDGARNIVEGEEDSGGPSATLGPFDRNAPFAEPEVVDAQSAVLAELIGENRLAYLAGDGVVIVDLQAGTAPTAEFAPESFDQFGDLAELSGFELLSEGSATYGIAKGTDLTVHQFSNSGRLVPTAEDGIFSITGDPAEEWDRLFVATSAGFFMADLPVPADAHYVNIAGLGTLVSPLTGGTYLAGIEGFAPYSDHRVVAGTATHQIEVHCDGLLCHPQYVNRETGDWEQIPDEFGGDSGRVSVSPDGRWVLRTESADDVAFDTETGGFHRLDSRPKGPIAWSPDSSFAVWFDPLTNDPLLQVMYPEQRTSETINLAELGAADRAGSDVLVFS